MGNPSGEEKGFFPQIPKYFWGSRLLDVSLPFLLTPPPPLACTVSCSHPKGVTPQFPPKKRGGVAPPRCLLFWVRGGGGRGRRRERNEAINLGRDLAKRMR